MREGVNAVTRFEISTRKINGIVAEVRGRRIGKSSPDNPVHARFCRARERAVRHLTIGETSHRDGRGRAGLRNGYSGLRSG